MEAFLLCFVFSFIFQASWKNLKRIKSELLITVNSFSKYFSDWKIRLNESKTEFSIFTKSTKMLKKMSDDVISLNNQSFQWKNSIKYLGVWLDNKLLLKSHIDKSIAKASSVCFSTLYCLLKRNLYVPVESKLQIYRAFIRPILVYACPVFANSSACYIQKLQVFQNKILRLALDINWFDFMSVDDIHVKSSIPLMTAFISRLTEGFYAKIQFLQNDLISCLGQ